MPITTENHTTLPEPDSAKTAQVLARLAMNRAETASDQTRIRDAYYLAQWPLVMAEKVKNSHITDTNLTEIAHAWQILGEKLHDTAMDVLMREASGE